MLAEHRLHPSDFIWPLFVCDGKDCEEPIGSLPGVSPLERRPACRRRRASPPTLGIPCIALFPNTPDDLRTDDAREALNADNLICRAIKAIKDAVPEIGVLTDVALDPYTAHGHDGLIDDGGQRHQRRHGEVLVEQALVQAEAGADIVAPSDMMDGRVAAIREALEDAGHQNVAIMAYAAKYASAFYGPFREAVGSQGRLKGDKRGYQMDPANIEEALREVELDLAEGADFVMVKPGLPYLDVVARVPRRVRRADLRLPGERRVCDDRGRRGGRRGRPRRADPRDPARLQARRRDRRAHLSRARRRAADRRLAPQPPLYRLDRLRLALVERSTSSPALRIAARSAGASPPCVCSLSAPRASMSPSAVAVGARAAIAADSACCAAIQLSLCGGPAAAASRSAASAGFETPHPRRAPG